MYAPSHLSTAYSSARPAAAVSSASNVRRVHLMLLEALICSAALIGIAAALLQHIP